MVEYTWTSIIVSVIIFVGLLGGGVYLITAVDPNNGLNNSTKAQIGNATSTVNNLLGQSDIQDQNAKPQSTDSSLNPVGATGNTLSGFKDYKSVISALFGTVKSVLSVVPNFVWWIIRGIIVILLISLTIRAWLRINP